MDEWEEVTKWEHKHWRVFLERTPYLLILHRYRIRVLHANNSGQLTIEYFSRRKAEEQYGCWIDFLKGEAEWRREAQGEINENICLEN